MTKIFTLWPDGSYSSMITKNFNKNLNFEIEYADTISNVISKVLETSINNNYWFVPIDNCYGWVVQESLSTIHENKELLKILWIMKLKINHCLASSNWEEDKSELTRIYSHPQALKQCSNFLSNLNTENIPTKSTTEKIWKISYWEWIICWEWTAVKNYLNILEKDIAPENNATRFALITNKDNDNELDLQGNDTIDNDTWLYLFDDFKSFYLIMLVNLINWFWNNWEFIYSTPNKNWTYDHLVLLQKGIDNLFNILKSKISI